MTISKLGWRIIAVVVAGAFYLTALRSDVYDFTSPHAIAHKLFGTGMLNFKHPLWLSLHIWVRKFYSVMAFAIVGFCTDRALDPTRAPAARSALLVAIYSLAIEIGQWRYVGYEPLAERIFDVGCGAFGGWLAISLPERYAARLQQRPRTP